MNWPVTGELTNEKGRRDIIGERSGLLLIIKCHIILFYSSDTDLVLHSE